MNEMDKIVAGESEAIDSKLRRAGIPARIVSSDDTFRFHCTQCGKCCTERDDILLTPRDLFCAAKEYGLPVEGFFKSFCEIYIGSTSRLPIVRFKPRGSVRRCPMLENRRCRIQKSKPAVCAMYPVGRATELDNDSGKLNVRYLLNDVICGDASEEHTVRGWLLESGVKVNDGYFLKWNRLLPQLHGEAQRLEKCCTDEAMVMVWELMSLLLYFRYDTSEPFDKQFDKNTGSLMTFLSRLTDSETEGEA